MELTQLTHEQVLAQCAQYNISIVGVTIELLTSNGVLFDMYKQQLSNAMKQHADSMRNAKLERINVMKTELLTDLQKYADVLAELGMDSKENSLFVYAWNVEGKVELHVGNKTVSKERMQTNGENSIVKTKYDWTATFKGVTYERGAEIAKVLGLFEEGKSINYRKSVEAHANKNPELNITFTCTKK